MKIQSLWYQKPIRFSLWWLIPFSILYSILVRIRRFFYQMGLFSKYNCSIPTIVVGNLTVGGTGKTPLVIHIATLLKQHGWNPGIVSRGYGRKIGRGKCVWVKPESDPRQVGDEPLLMAKRLGCPIVVCEDRAKATAAFQSADIADTQVSDIPVQVIISDDGLQHYAMERCIEISVVDAMRRYGNEFCLPAGPLREPLARLKTVDLQVVNVSGRTVGTHTELRPQEYEMELRPQIICNGLFPHKQKSLSDLTGQTVHAIAGIGHPASFFNVLKEHGLKVIEHAYSDHHFFSEKEIIFSDQHPILMTEKDAVKCQGLLTQQHWVLTVTAKVNPLFDARLLALLQDRKKEITGNKGNKEGVK